MTRIFVECKPDFLLIQKITGLSKRMIIHSSNKAEAIKSLDKLGLGIAIVDEDPGAPKPRVMRTYKLEYESERNIKVFVKDGKKYIITLSPRLEGWILEACKKSKMNIRKFGLPESEDELHDIINHNLDRFEKLIDSLIKANNEFIKELIKILKNIIQELN